MIGLLTGHFDPSPKNKEVLKAFLESFEFTFDGILVIGAEENITLIAEEFNLEAVDASQLEWQTAKVTNWTSHLDKVDFQGKTQDLLSYLKSDFCSLGEYHKTTLCK
jgi:hypothetical protein